MLATLLFAVLGGAVMLDRLPELPAGRNDEARTAYAQSVTDLREALVEVIDAAKFVREGDDATGVEAARRLEGAWYVLERSVAEVEAASIEGTQWPVTHSTAGWSVRQTRAAALVRAAEVYVRGGLHARDTGALERAGVLIELAGR